MSDHGLHFETELGSCALFWGRRGIRQLVIPDPVPGATLEDALAPDWVHDAARHIKAFLAGEPSELSGIPIDLEGLPPFRQKVYAALCATNQGETLTYGELARRAGSPGAARAVGQAVRSNPLPLLVPCHRVVAANGPGGFSLMGGLKTKERLLELEGVILRHTGHDAAPTPR